ncbi:hypothetical protein, conserved [Entamoeba dispar SAW760]|uniref:Sulfotransferase n=1 Tax=Entamoeba dispar (strain ATCC PRA-260 / SAW760) TaxID=370354 RepID=B0ESL5_ENTDS|nr:uncharacterized protein EDI_204410 [Entamoeba dispar SAW760]EDR22509.1 hypothetical protein, conserved [Entamoeba dispar SAW760]|eukprot:EDR22509.1 hypothetical protein, conserved [Entamoeba dispar SAW760]
MSLPNTYPEHYEINKESKYYRNLIPRPLFEEYFNNIKKLSIDFLCKLDPSHAELYKSFVPEIDNFVNQPFFKESMYEMFAGCEDQTSVPFKTTMRSSVAKMAALIKYNLELKIDKENIEKIKIKKPIYIVSLPRSGSTFTHAVLACDPCAKTIKLYEHLSPGHKTMTYEGRVGFCNSIIGQINSSSKDFCKCHAMDNANAPEEELFFMELLEHTICFGTSMPRWEQYRKSSYERDFSNVYEAVLNEMRMSAVEFPLPENGHFLMKCVSHFMTMVPFFNIMCADEIEARIVWIHREPVEEIKSAFYLLDNARARYLGDLGCDDPKWLHESIIKMHNIALKNAVSTREKWIAENPEREKQICDIGFNEMIADPVSVSRRIYEKFDMPFTDELAQRIKDMVTNNDPQKKHGRKEKKDEEFTVPDNVVREQYKWYFDKFGKYMPNYWGKK